VLRINLLRQGCWEHLSTAIAPLTPTDSVFAYS
jgi:hypothetical protein